MLENFALQNRKEWAYLPFFQGSIAYAKALQKANLLTEEESSTIITGLETVKQEWTTDAFIIQPADEDIHTANERRLKVYC